MNELQVIKGIKCFEDDKGIAQLKLEDVCLGLGFTKDEKKNGKAYTSIRWERVFGYLTSFGFDHQWAKEIFIPEPIFYMLAMKAESETAIKFQKIVAYEILPEIRKSGSYLPKNLSKELKAIFTLDEKQQQLEKKVDKVSNNFEEYKENSPLFGIECETLQKALQAKGVQILGGKSSQAYQDKSLRTKLYTDIQREIKRQFQIHSYKALKRSQLNIALEIINKYAAPLVIQDEIITINNQVSF